MSAPAAGPASPGRGAKVGVDAAAGGGLYTVHMRPAFQPIACLLAALAVAACAPKRIQGTDIQDTPDTRAIVATIDAYRQAVERRDADAVLSLVSRKYYDDAGTPDPTDDVDYDQLRKRIENDYAQVISVRLAIDVKRIDVEDGTAAAYVFYDERYRLRTKTGELGKQASDVLRMKLVREDGKWKFVSGL